MTYEMTEAAHIILKLHSYANELIVLNVVQRSGSWVVEMAGLQIGTGKYRWVVV
jgi:hypothetical protein